MFRARRFATLPQCCSHQSVQQRFYTPIWRPEQATDHITPLRDDDERRTLWASSPPIANLNAAVVAWIRFGNDPVLHTAFPVVHGGRHTQPQNRSTSPFSLVEDYMGTNMVFGSPEHVKESAAVWASYLERRYATRLRQSRRTAANHVGLVNAPEVFTDEADRPETKWSQDTFLRECAYMAERFLKEKVSNLQQFERAMKQASPDAYLAFHDAFQQQTQTQIPLPSPSVWHYEGVRRRQWAEKFIPISQEAQKFFATVLAADMKKLQNAPEKILPMVAAVFAKVGEVLVQRQRRRLDGRLWSALTEAEKDAFCMKEVLCWKQQVEEGEFDPPEGDDDIQLAEWKAEHDSIMQLMTAPIAGLSFTALDLWKHTIRCEELETLHIHTEERVRAISAAARKALYDATPFEAVAQGLVEAISRGQLDMGAGGLKPHFNDVWCQLHFAKFGASTITQHTTTACRQLLFFHAGSLREVAATAALYYATKPLSTSLDYASPYRFRRSLLALCSTYGVEMSYATQRPLLVSSAYLSRAEDLISAVVRNVARPFGERRRAALDLLRARYQRLAVPLQRVLVTAETSELLSCDADPSKDEGVAERETVTMWPLGSRRCVSYDWQTPQLEKLKTVTGVPATAVVGTRVAMTTQRVKELEDIKRRVFLEISLWRRLTPEERRRRQEAAATEAQQVAESLRAVPSLMQVQQYASSLYGRIEEEVIVPAAVVGEERGEVEVGRGQGNAVETDDESSLWEFAVMLDDRAALNAEQVVRLYLPYTDANGVPLPQGEYRVRVRGFDAETKHSFHPAHCAEAFSAPLQVFDAIPQLVEQFFKTASQAEQSSVSRIAASDFISFCAFLREAGLDVPMRCEFESGQALTADGDVFMDHFFELLRSEKFHQSCAQTDVTDAQRAIEPSCRAHWEVYHPGANEAEWAEARRSVLDRAMEVEREWWFPNEMLDVNDLATVNTNGLDPQMYPAIVRYGTELCTVLAAEGRYDSSSGLSATSVVNGTGAVESLTFSAAGCSSPATSMDEALLVAKRALNNAHNRHNTLAAFRLGPLAKQSQVLVFCGINTMEFGGKYARTYAYAMEKAKKELEGAAVSGRVVPGVDEDDVERVSEKDGVDRFASSTHPEQRKTRFLPRVGPGGVPMEDPMPDQKSLWGR